MNKKANTLIFLLLATLSIAFISIVCGVILLLIYSTFASSIPESVAAWVILFIIIASIVSGQLVYSKILLKQFLKRFDVEKYFDPLLPPKKGIRKLRD